MANGHQIGKSDLQRRDYSWRAQPPDDARVRGFPDDVLLDADEGYEVLDFINRFQRAHDRNGEPLTRDDALRVERLLQRKPGNVRSHRRVTEWVLANWSNG